MKFQKGHKKVGGKVKGTPNKITATVKEVFTTVFSDLQDDPGANLLDWGKRNPTEFYRLCAKLIPTAVDAKVNLEINKPVIIDWSDNFKADT